MAVKKVKVVKGVKYEELRVERGKSKSGESLWPPLSFFSFNLSFFILYWSQCIPN